MSNFNQGRQNIYIHPQNQQLLWNTMNKTPMFSNMNPQIKYSWFKGIIQQFYNSNQYIYDAALLQQINKETIVNRPIENDEEVVVLSSTIGFLGIKDV